jgi:hypothetical protein
LLDYRLPLVTEISETPSIREKRDEKKKVARNTRERGKEIKVNKSLLYYCQMWNLGLQVWDMFLRY